MRPEFSGKSQAWWLALRILDLVRHRLVGRLVWITAQQGQANHELQSTRKTVSTNKVANA